MCLQDLKLAGCASERNSMLGLVEVGIKRKLVDYDPSERSYSDQRQTILDISMCKLQSSPLRRVEPSLRRSVLIFNTLKQIEHELLEEGVKIHHMNTPSLLPTIQSEKFDLDPPPSADDLAYQMTEELKLSASKDSIPNGDDDDPVASVNPPTDVRLATHHVTLPDSQSMSSSDNPHRLFPAVAGMTCDREGASSSPRPATPASLPSPQQNNVDIFGDIDLSLYDFDLFSPLTPQLKAAPMSAEELLHTFPNSGSRNEWNALPSFSSASCYKNELLSEELDCIMQILACN